ncbi:peptidylprolyl isomerase [bacterium]|nr:peptidylprolyl isomerase [bacterium]
MKFRFAPPLLTLSLLSFLFTCSNMDNDVLATIDGNIIALDDFTAKNPAERLADKDNSQIDEKVDEFVRRLVFTRAALDRGLDADPDIQDKKAKAERRQMLQYVYDRAIMDKVITDEYLRETYEQTGTELNARHILLQFEGTPRSEATRTRIDALALMGQIKSRLSAGESFEDLATEFTDDPSGKDSGGDLGWFGWGKMVGPFQETAFLLEPGEISDIVETSFGFHVIKLEAKRDVKRGSFEEEKVALKNQSRKDKGQELNKAATAFLEGQKKDAGFKLNTDNIHTFFMLFEKSSFKQLAMDDVFEKLNFQAPLFRLHDEELGGAWIIEELSVLDDGQKPRFKSENQLLSMLDQLVTQTLIIRYGDAEKYAEEVAFSEKIDEMVERYAYDAFVSQEINENLDPTDEELLEFYEANKDSKYSEKRKVQVREIFVKDSLLAVDLKKRVDAGEMIDLLAGRYSERKATKENRGELPPFQEGRYGLMGKKAFTMAVGEFAGPIKLGNGYSIIKLESIIPEGAKPYNKVKGRVRTEILGDLRSKRNGEVYSELVKEYPVKVNYAAVHAFYAGATSE